MTTQLRVLIAEDSEDDAQLILHQLRRGGYDPRWERVDTPEAMTDSLNQKQWDVIICDYNMPRFSGPLALKLLREREIDIPFIIVSGGIGEETAVAIMKAGAHDYVMKDRIQRLPSAVEREIREATMRREHARAEDAERLRARWSEALLNLLQFSSSSETEIVAYAVETLVALTESKLCFVGLVDSEETTMSGHVWSQHAMQECAVLGGKPVQFDVAQGGLWTAPIRQLQAIIVNDYAAAHPLKKGCPAGHVPLNRFLGVPVIREGRAVLVAGLANKVEEYSEQDMSEILMFLEGLWGVLDRNRAVEALRLKNLVFDASIAANSIADVTGVITEVNDAFLRLWAYPGRDEVVGKPLPRFFNDPNEAGAILAALNGTGRWEGYFSAVRSDGSVFMAHGLATTLRDAQGGIVGYQSAILDITERKKNEEKLRETLDGLHNALGGIIQVLSAITEKRDPYTAGHQRRVADLARAIGQEMGLSADRLEGLRIAGIIHDIGKVSIPAEILSKPTRLTEIEYNLIQTHSQAGYDILRDIDFSWPLADIVLQHHERINGSGYPHGLKGENILLEARILAVSDVVEALASHRPYRPALGIEVALEEIGKNKGVLYDPDVVAACLTLFREKRFELK